MPRDPRWRDAGRLPCCRGGHVAVRAGRSLPGLEGCERVGGRAQTWAPVEEPVRGARCGHP